MRVRATEAFDVAPLVGDFDSYANDTRGSPDSEPMPRMTDFNLTEFCMSLLSHFAFRIWHLAFRISPAKYNRSTQIVAAS